MGVCHLISMWTVSMVTCIHCKYLKHTQCWSIKSHTKRNTSQLIRKWRVMAHLSIGFIVQHLWHGIPICLWPEQTMHYDNRPICWHKRCLCWFIWCICHFYRFDAVIKTISVSSWICAPKTDNTKEGYEHDIHSYYKLMH